MGTQPRLAQLNQPRPRPVIVPALLQPPTTALRLRRPTTHQPRPARPEAGQLGAIWSSAAPEFGARSVIDRFAQIEPKVLLAVDGYRYGGKDFDRSGIVDGIHAEVGGELVRLRHLDGSGWEEGFLEDGPLDFERVPFGHPLWVLYSSGTTGLPKAIVHSQGGIL